MNNIPNIKQAIMRAFISMVGLGIMACNKANLSDLERYVNSIENQEQIAVDEYPAINSSILSPYRGQQFRDPFFISGNDQQVMKSQHEAIANPKTCQVPPARSNQQSVLAKSPLKMLKVMGFFVSNGVRWGLISDTGQTLYQVKKGSIVGENFGYVAQVNETTISVVEYFKQSNDCWLSKTVQITTNIQTDKERS